MATWKRSKKNSGYKKRRRREGALIRLLEQLKFKGKTKLVEKPNASEKDEVLIYDNKQIARMEKEVEILKQKL